MAAPEYYKLRQAEQHLANCEVRAISEALITTMLESRPRDPLRALLLAFERMEEDGFDAIASGAAIPAPLVTPRFVLLMGPPGSGKTVQASEVATLLHGVLCSLSSLVRDALKGGRLPGSKEIYVPPPLQEDVRAAKTAITLAASTSAPCAATFSSSLTPDLAARLVVNRVRYEMRRVAKDAATSSVWQQTPQVLNVILDGFPKTIAEALALEKAAGQAISLVVALRCSEASLQKRRRPSASSAALPSLRASEEFWKAQHKLREADGEQSIQNVTKQLVQLLEE